MTSGSSTVAPELLLLDVVTVDAQPEHLAAAPDLFLADDGDVVLGRAGHRARVAAGARVEIDRHPPLVALAVVLLRPERQRAGRRRLHLGEVGVRAVLGVGRLVSDRPAPRWSRSPGSGRRSTARRRSSSPGLRPRSRGPRSIAAGRSRSLSRSRPVLPSCAPSRGSTRSSCRPGRGRSRPPAFTERPPTAIITTSLSLRPSCSAVAGETMATLSQTIFVTGSGISRSHVLLAWRPSTIFGHGAKVTSSDP